MRKVSHGFRPPRRFPALAEVAALLLEVVCVLAEAGVPEPVEVLPDPELGVVTVSPEVPLGAVLAAVLVPGELALEAASEVTLWTTVLASLAATLGTAREVELVPVWVKVGAALEAVLVSLATLEPVLVTALVLEFTLATVLELMLVPAEFVLDPGPAGVLVLPKAIPEEDHK